MSTILVVDDMAIIRAPIAASLQAAGFRTLCAAGGLEALVLLAERPDLILLDIQMPEMDGLTFLRLLRRSPRGATIPVLLLTAEDDRATVFKAAKLGAQGYILKSTFSLKDLVARVQQVLACPQTVREGGGQPPGSHSAGAAATNAPIPSPK